MPAERDNRYNRGEKNGQTYDKYNKIIEPAAAIKHRL
jgi:hypothetical protein